MVVILNSYGLQSRDEGIFRGPNPTEGERSCSITDHISAGKSGLIAEVVLVAVVEAVVKVMLLGERLIILG